MNPNDKKLTTDVGAPVADNTNSLTAGERGGMMLQDVWHMEKLALFLRLYHRLGAAMELDLDKVVALSRMSHAQRVEAAWRV